MMSRSNIEGAAKACLSFLSSRFALEARFDERGLSVLLALVDAILEQAHEDSLPAPVAPVARHRKRSLIAKYEDEDWCSFVFEPTDGDEWVAMVTCKDDQGSGISTYLSAAQARDAGELLLQLAGAATEATPSEALSTPTTNTSATNSAAAYAADDAYSAELRRLFGKAAGDARYDARGMSTPELRRLSDAKLAADAAMLRNGLVTRRQ